ncbi:metal ABC transporter substrate-binding protein [Streptomyces sp. 3MP-14]|uniref:Lipoprotein n=1 Tax=Streptomyces mimosae TaxID=2586635 RepID=A0A5N6A1B5_9ACTN|nr:MULTISPECIES: MetQ/NlpA family ABC transporter substrate-binding protein [Streptomyces]KAB8162557.1 metal ABC transporter substrate-binding protein [Streptomyces mimosae]KAB8174384.1 metal ABC transporter substrate-binding protein [Streptomyces sp. 3MP-14]
MRTNLRHGAVLAATTALALALAACGTDSDPDTGGGSGDGAAADPTEPLSVAATPVPQAEILQFVKDNLAEEAGLDLDIREVTDYVIPNTLVNDGDVDANFFQHAPYLDDFNAQQGTDIVPVINVHLEPLGLYSNDLTSADELGEGATIAIPNDATNEGRALQLLAANGLIELADGVGTNATPADVTEDNGITFQELEAASLPRSLEDFDAAVINGNFALEAELVPAEDALVLEEAEGNPYANFLAVKSGNEDDPRVQTLAELLNSDEVRQYIEETYQGSVVPAFGAPTS